MDYMNTFDQIFLSFKKMCLVYNGYGRYDMKKRLFIMVLICALTMNFSGCTNKNENVSTISDETDNSVTDKNEDVSSSIENEIVDSENAKSYFVYLTDSNFQNNYVVASLNSGINFSTNIVFNDNGEAVFKSGSDIVQTGDYFRILKVGEPNKTKSYYLSDNQGNVLFGVNFESDDNFYYLDSGDGYLATLHKNSGFSETDYRVSIYGSTGELIKEFSFTDSPFCEYYGAGVFYFEIQLGGYDTFEFFYNAKIDSVFYEKLDTEFINGKSLKFNEFDDLIGYYTEDGDFTEFQSPVSCFQTISGGSENYHESIEPGYGSARTILCDGVGIYKDNISSAYYMFNLEDKKSYPLNEINGELELYDNVYGRNGYVALPLVGADSELYTAIYDSEGTCILNPEDSLKGYLCHSIADNKAFFVNDISDNERDIKVYDLKKNEFIDASKYGKIIPETDYSNNIAIAKTYINADEHWFETFIDKNFSSIFEYDKVNSYYELNDPKKKTKGNYAACIELDLETIKDVAPLDTNFVWTASENYIDTKLLTKGSKIQDSEINSSLDESNDKQSTKADSESDSKTYDITFEADELIEQAGLKLGGHVGIAVLSNLTCSNGNANIETSTIYIYDSLVRVKVTGATAGEVVLEGTITTYGLDTFDGETFSYPDGSGEFLVSKNVGDNFDNSKLDSKGNMSYPVDNIKGQINCHGGTVAGFTTDYIVNGGAVEKVRNSLGDTWHVTAKNVCDNYGTTWYELWDSDDGDYYGWVDFNYIDFY